MTNFNERRCVVGSEGDVTTASQAALLFARRAGFSVMRQMCVAGLVSELGKDVVKRSGRAVVVIRDESDDATAKVRVLLQDRGPVDAAHLAERETAESWASRWEDGELTFELDPDGTRLSVAMGHPKTLH